MPLPEFKQIVDEAKTQFQEIGPAELKRMLDARVIAGAVRLPRGILERDIDQVTSDKDRKIVLYCQGGFRSALAALNLKKMGFRNVISLDGGYRGWQQPQP
jgi:rhodanese-related sulfurtransferase